MVRKDTPNKFESPRQVKGLTKAAIMEEHLSIATISVHLSSDDDVSSVSSRVLGDDSSSLNDEGSLFQKKEQKSERHGNAQNSTCSLRSSLQFDLRTVSNSSDGYLSPATYETSWNKKRDASTMVDSIHPYQPRKKPRKLPKRPLSPYSIYFQSQRIIIQAEAENLGFPRKLGFEDCEEIIGEQWESLGKKARLIYERLAVDDELRYHQEMKTYNQVKLSAQKKRRHSEDAASSVEENEVIPTNFVGERLHTEIRTVANLFPVSPPRMAFTSAKDVIATMMDSSKTPLPTHPLKHSERKKAMPLLQSQPSNISRLMLPSLRVDINRIPSIISIPSEGSPALQPSPGNNEKLDLSPGMEVALNDSRGKFRKYSVEYKCYSMSNAEAFKFARSWNGVVRSDLSLKAHDGATECPDN